jgi:CRP-like cAMP-binding protein
MMNLKILFILLRNAKIRSFRKGEIIIPESSRERSLYYIKKGLVRSYLVNEKGEEITFQLFAENNVFSNVHAVLFNEPSKFYFQAIEHTKVYFVDYDLLMKMTSGNADLLELNRSFLAKAILKRAFQRSESFVFLNPEERYIKFVKENSTIINRVPDMYIAHVLGITPVSLSRIRNRIANKR